MSTQDRLAVTDLVHRYAAYVDSGLITEASELFTEDAELVIPRPPESLTPIDAFTGRQEIAQALSRVLRLDGTFHEIVGHVIDPVNDGIIRGRTASVAHHFISGKDDQWHVHYKDSYRRTASGWRIARRAYTVHSMRTVAIRHPAPLTTHEP